MEVLVRSDVIILKDLNTINNNFINSNKDVLLDEEIKNKIGCASIYLKANSICSNFCVNYINNKLNNKTDLNWGDIGPETVENLYKKHSNRIILNKYDITKNGCNYINWLENPGYNRDNWILDNKEKAINVAQKLIDNINCNYVITWTIYRENNIDESLVDFVFKNPNSIFTHLINLVNIEKFTNNIKKCFYLSNSICKNMYLNL